MDEDKQLAVGQEDEGDALDLGYCMAPMSRQQLEMLVVQMVSRHPELCDLIVQESRKPVDTYDVLAEAMDMAEAGDIVKLVELLGPHLENACHYVKGGDYTNAVALLEAITEPFVSTATSVATPEDAEDKAMLDLFFMTLETSWQDAFTMLVEDKSLKKQAADGDSLMELFGKLAVWRKALTEQMGPVFSDPLRTLKKLVTAARSSASSSKRSAETAPVGGANKKNKQ